MICTRWILVVLAMALPRCGGAPDPSATDDTTPGHSTTAKPVVCVQVVHGGAPASLTNVMALLRSRGLPATILVSAEAAEAECAAIQSLRAEGFEFGVFVRPRDVEAAAVSLASLPRAEQEAAITAVKGALEACLGGSAVIFGCVDFAQNRDTYEIVDALGFSYNVGFVVRTEHQLPGHPNAILPYQVAEHAFKAVPLSSVFLGGQWRPLADNALVGVLDADKWFALLTQEFDRLREQGRPMLIQVHSDTTGEDATRRNAFAGFLDYAGNAGARFLTVSEYVDWSATRPTDPVCLAP